MKIIFIFGLTALFCSTSAQKATFSLKQCIDYSLEHNLNIQSQQLNSQQAQIQYNKAYTDLLPNLNANADGGVNFSRSQNIQNIIEKGNTKSASLGINSSIDLFNGLGKYNTIAQRSLELQAASYDLQYRKDQIALNVASQYLKVLLDKQLLDLAKLQVEMSKETQSKLEVKLNSGAISKEMVLENKAQVARDKANLIETTNNLQYDLLVLAQTIEYANPDSFDIIQPEDPLLNAEISMLSSQEIYNKTAELRPELQAAKLRIESNKKQYLITRSYLMPSLSIGASYKTGYLNPPSISFINQFKDNHSESVGINLRIPIFNKFDVSNQMKLSKLQIKKAEFDYEIQKKAYKEEIQKALANAQAAYASLNANKESKDASDEAFQFAQQRLSLQAISIFDYNELKNKTLQAQIQYYQSLYQFVFSAKILDFYMGKSIE